MKRHLFIVLSMGLLACGGGSKPATQEPDPAEETSDPSSEAGDPEMCCCDYIREWGEGDEMGEEQTYEMMPRADCEGQGQCGEDESACAVEE